MSHSNDPSRGHAPERSTNLLETIGEAIKYSNNLHVRLVDVLTRLRPATPTPVKGGEGRETSRDLTSLHRDLESQLAAIDSTLCEIERFIN